MFIAATVCLDTGYIDTGGSFRIAWLTSQHYSAQGATKMSTVNVHKRQKVQALIRCQGELVKHAVMKIYFYNDCIISSPNLTMLPVTIHLVVLFIRFK